MILLWEAIGSISAIGSIANDIRSIIESSQEAAIINEIKSLGSGIDFSCLPQDLEQCSEKVDKYIAQKKGTIIRNRIFTDDERAIFIEDFFSHNVDLRCYQDNIKPVLNGFLDRIEVLLMKLMSYPDQLIYSKCQSIDGKVDEILSMLEKISPVIERFDDEAIESNKKAWINEYLSDNSVEIILEESKTLRDIFQDIQTILPKECWILTQRLLGEIMLNAQKHGSANGFWLLISDNQISLEDDGNKFNTLALGEIRPSGGGSYTFQQFHNTFQEVNINYSYHNGHNITSFMFPCNTFIVNGLCKIIINGDLVSRSCFNLKYNTRVAKYYYIDFTNFDISTFYWLVSGIIQLVEFCMFSSSIVFWFVPKDSAEWDWFVDDAKNIMSGINKWTNAEEIIRIIRV